MTFLALGIEKSTLMLQKDQLEFQEMIATDNYNYVTEQLAELDDEKVDTSSAAYKALERQQELYDSQKGSIESQLEAINAEIDSYGKAVQTNVKNECAFTISS